MIFQHREAPAQGARAEVRIPLPRQPTPKLSDRREVACGLPLQVNGPHAASTCEHESRLKNQDPQADHRIYRPLLYRAHGQLALDAPSISARWAPGSSCYFHAVKEPWDRTRFTEVGEVIAKPTSSRIRSLQQVMIAPLIRHQRRVQLYSASSTS
jgi:hypothetical protein